MTVQIIESGVVFGDFQAEDLLEFEKSEGVAQLGDGISKVEFVLKQNDQARVIFLEAKTSIPREPSQFFEDIKQKMLHSLVIWFASVCGRHATIKEEIGDNLRAVSVLKKQFS